MTHHEFMKEYAPHIGTNPIKTPLQLDGYKLTFPSGDVYIHDEQLKPGVKIPKRRGIEDDDCIYRNYWNGELITDYNAE